MDSDTKDIIGVYIQLLDEGSFLARKTTARVLGGDRYKILANSDYDPNDEHWEFPPDSIVRLRKRFSDGEGEYLLAVDDADPIAILVPYRGGGNNSVRPMDAVPLRDQTFKILPTYRYTRDEDQLEFRPGEVIRLKKVVFDGKEKLLAIRAEYLK